MILLTKLRVYLFIAFGGWILSLLVISCSNNAPVVRPEYKKITESVYASGVVKARNQYQCFVLGTGIVSEILVKEGDVVKKGDPILRLHNEVQALAAKNAELQADYADIEKNIDKVRELKTAVELAKKKYELDSSIYFKQKALFEKGVGSSVDLELKELNFKNASFQFQSAQVKYRDAQRLLQLQSEQSKISSAINKKAANDFTLTSEVDGRVYALYKKVGEVASPQLPIAVIGDATKFYMELTIDEYDIVKIKVGQKCMITMDTYRGKVFEGVITKLVPLLNERNRTFTVEAEFVHPPEVVYPNSSLEANIIIQTKEKALVVPTACVVNDSTVRVNEEEFKKVKIGLRDFKFTEIVEGLTDTDELVLPVKK